MKLLQPEFTFIFLGGFHLAMTVLHFILYTYNRHKKANLIYSMGMFMAFINYTMVHISTEEGYNESSGKLTTLLNMASNGVLLYFVAYHLIATSIPLLKKIVRFLALCYVAGFTVLLISENNTPLFNVAEIVLSFTAYTTAAFICVIGLVKKIPNFTLIVAAALLLIFTQIFVAVDIFKLWNLEYTHTRTILIILGYTTPFIVYSAYLSKDLAITSKKLLKEQILNERLTREKYEQELVTRKILEVQNIELERSVKERTRQISLQKEELEAQAEKIKEIDKVKSRFFALWWKYSCDDSANRWLHPLSEKILWLWLLFQTR